MHSVRCIWYTLAWSGSGVRVNHILKLFYILFDTLAFILSRPVRWANHNSDSKAAIQYRSGRQIITTDQPPPIMPLFHRLLNINTLYSTFSNSSFTYKSSFFFIQFHFTFFIFGFWEIKLKLPFESYCIFCFSTDFFVVNFCTCSCWKHTTYLSLRTLMWACAFSSKNKRFRFYWRVKGLFLSRLFNRTFYWYFATELCLDVINEPLTFGFCYE